MTAPEILQTISPLGINCRAGKYWTIHQWDVAAIAARKLSGKAWKPEMKGE